MAQKIPAGKREIEDDGEEENGGGLIEEEGDDGELMVEQEGWTKSFARSWDAIEEDKDGNLVISAKQEQRRRKKTLHSKIASLRIEKGMIRYLFIVIDCSISMNSKRDLKPNRLVVTQKLVELFILEYFDQNPLSQIGIIIAHNGIATKLTDLGGNPKQQIETLNNVLSMIDFTADDDDEYDDDEMDDEKEKEKDKNNKDENENDSNIISGGGVFSLENSLQLVKQCLSQIPIHGSRECLLISSALSSIDANDIFLTMKSLKKFKIRCNVISLSAELHILKLLTQVTSGTFDVILNESHFKEVLLSKVTPQAVDNKEYQIGKKWIEMGFPLFKSLHYPSLCSCHLQWKYSGYMCPKCSSIQCELPTDCNVCGLSLILSPHLVRSYHHLFPIPEFIELKTYQNKKNKSSSKNAMTNAISHNVHPTQQLCYGCHSMIDTNGELMEVCGQCHQQFCIECNVFIHESLHNCPGCMSGYT